MLAFMHELELEMAHVYLDFFLYLDFSSTEVGFLNSAMSIIYCNTKEGQFIITIWGGVRVDAASVPMLHMRRF